MDLLDKRYHDCKYLGRIVCCLYNYDWESERKAVSEDEDWEEAVTRN